MRPHLQNIDNVPLLVPLFTDCTPESKWPLLLLSMNSFQLHGLAHPSVDMGEGKEIHSRNLEGHIDINYPLLLSVGSRVLTEF